MEKLPAQPLNGLIDGMIVLQCLAGSAEPVSCSVLAEKLGIEKTKINRILKTLSYLGFVHRTKSRQYMPGPAMHVLSAQSLHASGLLRKAFPVLEELCRYKMVVALGVLWRDSVCYLYHWDKSIKIHEAIGRMGLLPASYSSLGLAMLSEKSEDEIRELYEGREIPDFENNIKKLLASLRTFKQNGIAIAERENGTRSIAVNVGSPAYCAIALSGNIEPGKVDFYSKILKDAAKEITVHNQ